LEEVEIVHVVSGAHAIREGTRDIGASGRVGRVGGEVGHFVVRVVIADETVLTGPARDVLENIGDLGRDTLRESRERGREAKKRNT
jgi:hypothetical protein